MLNLINRDMVIPSAAWLFLVGANIWTGCKKVGIDQYLINLQGCFAAKHFADSISTGSHTAEIRFGYQFFGYRFFYLTIVTDKIQSVTWSTGQDTSLVGRDMNDWHIAVWFDHDDAVNSQKRHGKHDRDVHIVGPSRRKETIVAFGHSFVDFLRNSGVPLIQGGDECGFVRATANIETR